MGAQSVASCGHVSCTAFCGSHSAGIRLFFSFMAAKLRNRELKTKFFTFYIWFFIRFALPLHENYDVRTA